LVNLSRVQVPHRGERKVIVYRCDVCGEVAECAQKQIEGREYDFCARCWGELESKLQGKGRPLAKREMVLLPPRVVEREEAPEKPAPGTPPTIYAHGS
jgi:hypothetical protein